MIEGILILVLCVFTASAGHLKGRVRVLVLTRPLTAGYDA